MKLIKNKTKTNFKKDKFKEKERENSVESRYIERCIRTEIKNRKPIILDIGCGWGFWEKRLDFSYSSIIAIDVRNISQVKSPSSNIKFILANGLFLPFKDHTFNIVFLFEVLEHIEKGEIKLFKEIKRVLKKDGVLLATTPNRDRLANRIKKILGRPVRYPFALGIDYYTPEDKEVQWHFREYSREGLVNLFKDNGFSQIEVEGIGLGFGRFAICDYPKIFESFSRTWFCKVR